jgi:polyisoprenoid-binding protein YceI
MQSPKGNPIVETITPPPTKTGSRRRRWISLLIGLVALAAIAAGTLFWFFGGEAPAGVDLEETASAVDDGTATASPTGIDGTWSVDTTGGEFTVTEHTDATFAGFRVEEVLQSIGSSTAVGRTPDVAGTVEIDGTTLSSAEIVVDLTSIQSDEARREGRIQQALGTDASPTATFLLTEPIELGDGAAKGEVVSAVATGELTINGVTNTVEIPVEARLVDAKILVTGSTGVTFSDYDVTVPSAPVVVSVEDRGILEFQLWLSR